MQIPIQLSAPESHSPQQLEEGWNNPLTEDHYYLHDEDEQDWNQPITLRESPPHDNQLYVPVGWKEDEDPSFHRRYKATLVTPRLALLLRNNNNKDNYNTWYLDSCCGQHMVGSTRYVSNLNRAPATFVTVANSHQLRANSQGIVVLQARDSNTHISFNDVLYVPDLRFNLLSAGQLRDCGVILTTDLATRDLILTYAPPDTPPESFKYLGRARSINGIYVLDFDVPSCEASSDELVDLVPLEFAFMNEESWQHPDGRPWIRRSPHPREINLHNPDINGLCTTCHTPAASRTEQVEREFVAIQEAESAEEEPTGMTEEELAVSTYRIFGEENKQFGHLPDPRPTPRSETLRFILEANATTIDEEGRPRPYTREVYRREIDPAWKDPDEAEELSVKEEQDKVRAEKKQKLYEERIAAGWSEESARRGGWGDDDYQPGEGATWASAIGAWGSSGSGMATTGGWGTEETAEADLTQEELEEAEQEMRTERGEEPPRVTIPLGRPPPARSPPRSPWRWDSTWTELEEGNVPPTPARDSLGPISRPDPFARFIEGTTTPLTIIPDREFLALYLSTAPAEGETTAKEAEGAEDETEPGEEEEPPLQIPQETEEEAAEHRARYMRSSGIRAEDDLWHQRLGHPSRQTLANCLRAKVFPPGALLRPDGTEPHNTPHPLTCTVCPTAALTHSAYPSLEPSTNRYKKLQKVYSDFIVLTCDGLNGEKYTLTFIDAYSRYVWIANVDARSKAPEVFRIWLAHAQRQSGRKLKIWQSDGAKEFRSHELESVLTEKGIKHEISLPYAHQQQGVAERVNRTLMTKVRALMNQSGLPKKFWPYAMNHAVRLYNLLSTTANRDNLSPHMKWTGSRGDPSMLRVWGCMVQYRPTSANIGKFAQRARWGVHLGLSNEHKGWLILDVDSKEIVPARDILFYERLTLKQWVEDEQRNQARGYVNSGRSFASPEDEAAAAAFDRDDTDDHPGIPPRPRSDDDDDDDSDDAPTPGPTRRETAPSTSSPGHDSDDDDVVEVPITDTAETANASGLQLLGLHTSVSAIARAVEPKNPRQALTGPHAKEWRAAMDAELKALESRDTWVLVDRAAVKGRRVLSGKWVFRLKTNADGTIERFKARWVVRGYDQRHGIDFDQTFAPVSRHTSVRILLAIAAAKHLPLRQIDVKNAFLYALVDATIFVEQPHTYGEGDPRVCQLKKSLYGIKQAPRLWQQHLHKILLEIGFRQLPHDPGMYRLHFNGDYILLTVYVDDLLYTGTCNTLLTQFEENLAKRVDITTNHNVTQFLGLNITYAPEAIHLSASKYAEQLGERFNISRAPLSTPYRSPSTNYKPDNKPLSPAGLQLYQQQLGCLLFASVTCRPDLSYIASQLAQYSRKPVAENQLDLERALQYFISTPDIGLSYSTLSTTSFNLNGYVDADHAADPANRRSRTGFVFRLEPTGPISWNSQKQELVALSSAEAEYIAATAAVREGLYLQELLQEAKIPTSPTFRLHCDNQSAIKIANKPGFVNRTKHIALRYFFVKDEIDQGKVDLAYCPTTEMAADFLTKRLPRQQFKHCSDLTGVVKRVSTPRVQE
ncbi:unnamed protein product [Closterium sp. Yama58-4]|nr:unnamed protein product [Closterium sp. Yama58-4]